MAEGSRVRFRRLDLGLPDILYHFCKFRVSASLTSEVPSFRFCMVNSFANVIEMWSVGPSPEWANLSSDSYRERSSFNSLILLTAAKCSIFDLSRELPVFPVHSPSFVGQGMSDF